MSASQISRRLHVSDPLAGPLGSTIVTSRLPSSWMTSIVSLDPYSSTSSVPGVSVWVVVMGLGLEPYLRIASAGENRRALPWPVIEVEARDGNEIPLRDPAYVSHSSVREHAPAVTASRGRFYFSGVAKRLRATDRTMGHARWESKYGDGTVRIGDGRWEPETRSERVMRSSTGRRRFGAFGRRSRERRGEHA